MKKTVKTALLSMLMATAVVSGSAATLMMSADASTIDSAAFYMVDGASIRMGTPYGIRFIAEMTEDVTENENIAEAGILIAPYDYLYKAECYTGGAADMQAGNYQNLNTKHMLTAYAKDGSVENKIYETEDGNYRMNGVLGNLKLENYDREFIGIGYYKMTDGSYQFTEFNKADNVRTATYVAIQAYEYEPDLDKTKYDRLENYVLGAYLKDFGLTETIYEEENPIRYEYSYNGETYSTIAAAAEVANKGNWTVSISKTSGRLTGLGATMQLSATVKDGEDDFSVAGKEIVWTTSNKNVATVDENGLVTAVGDGDVTITASFLDAKATCAVNVFAFDGTFETATKVPSFMSGSKMKSVEIVDLGGNKVVKATTTDDSTSDVGIHIRTDVLRKFFADENVDYLAFDIMSNAGKTGPKVYYQNATLSGWTQYENGTYDSIPTDSFKTYWLPRSIYEGWEANIATQNMPRFIMIGGSLVCGGESFYIDNIRPATEEDKTAALFSFEMGGFRTNNGNSPLFCSPSNNTWQLAFSNIDSTTAKFTSEIVSDGVRAVTFKKFAGDTAITFNHNADTSMEVAMRAAGYISYDLYVPADSNAKTVWSNNNQWAHSLQKGWNTIYAKIDATNNEISRFNDTTASTYVVDNIRFVTEEEFNAKMFGFESGGGVIRATEIGSNSESSGVFYYYGGQDSAANFSFSFSEGGGSGDVATVSNPRFDTTIKHSGDYSLAFEKGKGYMSSAIKPVSNMHALLKDGFSFWIYSTTAIDGTGTNFINGSNQKFNGGAGISIPANTWTRVIVRPEDINSSGRWIIMQGSWSGTIYIDDIQPGIPAEEEKEIYTITYMTNGGTMSATTQEVTLNDGYTLLAPTAPSILQEFVGWKDENGNMVDMSGTWTTKRNVVLTAVYQNVTSISFENGIVPSYMTAADTTASLTITDIGATDGNKALKITSNGGSPALKVTLDFLAAFFADPSVQYVAFDAKSGATKTTNFRRVTIRSNGSFAAEPYEKDVSITGINPGITNDYWKSFYFTRTDYNNWIAQRVSSERLIASGNFVVGDYILVDNIRGVTEFRHTAEAYGFDNGGVRLNDNDQTLLFYMDASDWTFNIQVEKDKKFTNVVYNNENVSDGLRALQFTKEAGSFNINLPSAKEGYSKVVTPTGYWAVDIYVPENSDATATYAITSWPGASLNKGGWTTIYMSGSKNALTITDTTGGTYLVDNIRPITAEEYNTATLGMEAGTGGLRDNVEASNVFYYYMGADHAKNAYSFAVTGSPLESVALTGKVAYDGTTALSFTKENGTINLQMRNDSTAYELLKNGFTFWIFSTVSINGKGTANFNNGHDQKLNGTGVNVSANTWTKITITADDIKHDLSEVGKACPFLKIQGSTAGTFYIDGIEVLPYEEPETLEYNVTVEETAEDGTMTAVLLGESTHTLAGLDVLPSNASDAEDMSYIRFGGKYGLDDYLVIEFTGDNIPLISFFTTNVTKSVYNQEENAERQGWIVANGMTTKRGLPYSGTTSNLSNRLNVIGPYMITSLYDNTTGTLAQDRVSAGNATNPCPITMPTLQSVDHPYRMVMGWTANGDKMNLCIYVVDLATGAVVIDQIYNFNDNANVNKANWEGDIVLYGHFYRTTYVDKIYPIAENKTFSEVKEMYKPEYTVYNGTWSGDELTLAASTHAGTGDNIKNMPLNSGYKEDMSYIAFDGTYGLNDYVVFDFTGDNFPFVSFFNSDVTNTIWNWDQDTNVTGWIISNGIRGKDGSLDKVGGLTGANASRIQFTGSNKLMYRYDNNGDTAQWRASRGSASTPSPISLRTLSSLENPDTYRAIIGFIDNNGNGVKAVMYVMNLVTGAVVLNDVCALNYSYSEGKIALHGQFGKTTVLDKVFGVEEDTTLNALISKYAVVEKDFDYSDEAAVTLDRYAYTSLSNGQWTLDTKEQVDNPTDFRTQDSSYETYKNAGFNIVLAQDMIATDSTVEVGDTRVPWSESIAKETMDRAYEAGLKVILTDWHLQIWSSPIKVVSGGGVSKSDSKYVPWIIGTDANATSGPAKEWIDTFNSLGLGTLDATRFATRDALDKLVYQELSVYMDHPAFYGVMLADEPSYHNAYCYGEIYKSIKRVMPECYVQYNLLPMENNYSTIENRYPGVKAIGKNITNAQIETAYKSYVESFLDTMGTDYIQYDDYPFKSTETGILYWTEENPFIDKTSLRNIQLVAEIAKERDLDVKVVTQSCVMKSGGSSGPVHIRQITEDDARWLNNYLMGFGVKQINYFTYWTKAASSSSGEYFVDGGSFVDRNGNKTALYNIMQAIMKDNDEFASTISHFDYNGSKVVKGSSYKFEDDHIIWGTMTANSFRWITNVTTSTDATLITELYDAEKYNHMYMVMNTIDPNEKNANKKDTTQSIMVTFDSKVTGFYVYDQYGNRTQQTGNTYTVSLTAGQAVYLLPIYA